MSELIPIGIHRKNKNDGNGNGLPFTTVNFEFTGSKLFNFSQAVTKIILVKVDNIPLNGAEGAPLQYRLNSPFQLEILDEMIVGEDFWVSVTYNYGEIDEDTPGPIAIPTFDSIYKGAIVPTSPAPGGTGVATWSANQAGTYTNFGGVVVNANSLATISRDAAGVFGISQTVFSLAGYAKTEDIQLKSNLVVGKNKFNKATAVIGAFLGNTNSVSVNATYDYSDFIKVIAGTQYVSNSSMRFTTYFDSNKNYLAGGSSSSITTFTPPVGVAYVKVTITHTNLNTFQLEIGSVATLYENYGLSVSSTEIPTLPYRQSTSITPLSLIETDWAIQNKNLFNSSKITVDKFIDWTNGVSSTNTSYSASEFISILPNTQYVSSALVHYAFYTAGKVFISGNNTNVISVSPSNAAYIRFSFLKTNLSTVQLEQGSTATSYQKYGFTAPDLNITGDTTNKPWSNCKTNCLGDSNTQGNKWQPYLVTNLGLLLTNFGVGGTKISGSETTAMNNNERLNLLAADAKLIIVMGGTNDWAQSVALGSDSSTDILTFNGGLNILIEKLIIKYSGVLTKFLFIGTPYGEFIDYASRGWSTSVLNTQGLTTKDYAEATRKRCFAYNIPFCDPSNLGLNNLNVADYLANDGNYIHFNNEGGRRLAEIVIGKLKSIEPVIL